MGRARWASDEQLVWLTSNLPDYWEAQARKRTKAFWPKLDAGYFKKFPYVEGAEIGRGSTLEGARGRIHEWYGNHGRKSTVPQSGRTKVLKLRGAPKRKVPWQVYSDMFYVEKLRDFVDAEYDDYLVALDTDATPEAKIAFRNKIIIAAYEVETEDVQAQVLAACERQDGVALIPAAVDCVGLSEEQIGELGVNLGIQRNIDALGTTLQTLTDEVFRVTGWTMTIMAGGPVPALDGNIMSFSLHSGSTSTSKSFGQWHDDFNGLVVSPFKEWLGLVHPESVRQKRAIAAGSATLPIRVESDGEEHKADDAATSTAESSTETTVNSDAKRPPASESADALPMTDSSGKPVSPPPPHRSNAERTKQRRHSLSVSIPSDILAELESSGDDIESSSNDDESDASPVTKPTKALVVPQLVASVWSIASRAGTAADAKATSRMLKSASKMSKSPVAVPSSGTRRLQFKKNATGGDDSMFYLLYFNTA
ncbi:hypothetical protein BD410DRAFT_166323 [Rickenella mellea]|uniref:Uncharacterized protein n=1 Tax=Rickenella mellea TaxID=50990 RepID=A0A4Y7PHA2_9AGAM|nr:hypothetical protein BD410DRAFT_166323 [Rickenella mellea]